LVTVSTSAPAGSTQSPPMYKRSYVLISSPWRVVGYLEGERT
jgi:hypothetical protein